MTVFTGAFEVGTRVYCSLPFAGCGVISLIEGDQQADSVRAMGGVGVAGGNARIEVVFQSGVVSRKLPEAILRGSSQWRIQGDVASAEELAALIKNAEQIEAQKRAEQEKAEQAFQAEVQRLAGAAEFAHLKQDGDRTGGGQAAANIRKELKKTFPGVKFSVRKISYSRLQLTWVDGPTIEAVEGVTRPYRAGSFCGMEDIYNHEKTPWTQVFGEADYVFHTRDLSLDLIEKAIEQVAAEYAGDLKAAGLAVPTVEQFKSGGLFTQQLPNLGVSLQQLVRQTAYGLHV